ncbi:NFX1-type zinc finger-containing protein 1-like [Tubulanus polymorphus]|uniref:NFX1-type zinc finger-containing protein 1-like n=1 Tax=Tubulanus polymorphus TaxID=672921 RepID=UPI003DA2D4FA
MAKGGRDLDRKKLKSMLTANEDDIENFLISRSDALLKKLNSGDISNKELEMLMCLFRKSCEWESVHNLLTSSAIFNNKGVIKDYIAEMNASGKINGDNKTFLIDLNTLVTALVVNGASNSTRSKLKLIIKSILTGGVISEEQKGTFEMLLEMVANERQLVRPPTTTTKDKINETQKEAPSLTHRTNVIRSPQIPCAGVWNSFKPRETPAPVSMADIMRDEMKSTENTRKQQPVKADETMRNQKKSTDSRKQLPVSLEEISGNQTISTGPKIKQQPVSIAEIMKEQAKSSDSMRRNKQRVRMEGIARAQEKSTVFCDKTKTFNQSIQSTTRKVVGNTPQIKQTREVPSAHLPGKPEDGWSKSFGTSRQTKWSPFPEKPQHRKPADESNHFVDVAFESEDRFIQAALQFLDIDGESISNFLKQRSSQMKYKLNDETSSPREVRIVLKLFAKCFEDASSGNLIRILTDISTTRWLDYGLGRYLRKIRWSNLDKEETESLENIVIVCKALMLRLPQRTAYPVLMLLSDLKKRSEISSFFVKNYESLLEKLTRAHELAESIVEANLSENIGNADEPSHEQEEPTQDFLDTVIYPTKSDIDSPGNIPINLARGKYKSPKNYLDTQFRLLREDFLAPLRMGIKEYCENAEAGFPLRRLDADAYIYTNVTFVGIADGFIVKFDHRHLRINWARTKRLLTGSLVCLSNDRFRTFVTGTIKRHDEKKLAEGRVEITIDPEYINSLSFLSSYTMVEATSFYEAYKHVLKRLQQLGEGVKNDVPIPFQQYFVDVSKKATPPLYMKSDPNEIINVRSFMKKKEVTVKEFLNGNWANDENGQLDQSQLKALHAVFSQELAVVQGPPGTGKTFIGLKVMEFLFANRKLWNKDRNDSIMVVCYTNHALDQFLEEVLAMKSRRKLIRIGGRCSEESPVYEHTLHSIRSRKRPRRKGDSEDEDEDVIIVDLYEEPVDLKRLRARKKEYDRILWFMKSQLLDGPFGRHLIKNLPRILPQLAQSSLFICSAPLWQCLAYWLLDVNPYDAAAGEDELEMLERLVFRGSNVKETPPEDVKENDEQTTDSNTLTLNVKDEADLILEEREVDGQDDGKWEVVKKKKAKRQNDSADEMWKRTNELKQKLLEELGETAKQYKKMESGKVQMVEDIWRLKPKQRFEVYLAWLDNYVRQLGRQFKGLVQTRDICSRALDDRLERRDLELLKNAEVIGMTTTGASKYSSLIQKLRPRILIVEEAAEVLEAHVVTALTERCEHAILIGDHKQLRPNPTVYKLAKDHNLDISFFERMIRNGYPVTTLTKQHRMRPEISAILVPHIYKKLLDHESVKTYPDVLGIERNVIFVDHSHQENPENESRSRSNEYEAEMIVHLARHLIKQGYSGYDITILTPYAGQMYRIKDFMKKVLSAERDLDELCNIRVTPVDNYQGEENNIILISFVRSNKAGNIGFLKTANRVCVALSRAKWGMYCIGNFTSYAKESRLWEDLVYYLRQKGFLMRGFPLTCQKHPKHLPLVKSVGDFRESPDGGCREKCDFLYECGHWCQKFCHNDDPEHVKYVCQQPCEKICPRGHRCLEVCGNVCEDCPIPCGLTLLGCGHRCISPCGQDGRKFGAEVTDSQPCNHDCMTTVNKILLCGHTAFNGRCSDNVEEMKCDALVQRTLECGHNKQVICGGVIESVVCDVILQQPHLLPCGHEARVRCHQKTSGLDLDHELKCKEACQARLPCGHRCLGICFDCSTGIHRRCREVCGRLLLCGHVCKKKCGEPCYPCNSQCEVHCWHRRCKRGCMEQCCTPCSVDCNWICEHHKCEKKCDKICDRAKCDEPCTKSLPMSVKKCQGLCGEPCPLVCPADPNSALTTGGKAALDGRETKYVRVSPCGHCIDSEVLEDLMTNRTHRGMKVVNVKRCPFANCDKPIVFCPRYGEEVRASVKLLKQISAYRASFSLGIEFIIEDLVEISADRERLKMLYDIVDAMHCNNLEEAETIVKSVEVSKSIIEDFQFGFMDNVWLQCPKGHFFKDPGTESEEEDIQCDKPGCALKPRNRTQLDAEVTPRHRGLADDDARDLFRREVLLGMMDITIDDESSSDDEGI